MINPDFPPRPTGSEHLRGMVPSIHAQALTLAAGIAANPFFGPWSDRPFLDEVQIVSDKPLGTPISIFIDWYSQPVATAGLTPDHFWIWSNWILTQSVMFSPYEFRYRPQQFAPLVPAYLRVAIFNGDIVSHAFAITITLLRPMNQEATGVPRALARRNLVR